MVMKYKHIYIGQWSEIESLEISSYLCDQLTYEKGDWIYREVKTGSVFNKWQ